MHTLGIITIAAQCGAKLNSRKVLEFPMTFFLKSKGLKKTKGFWEQNADGFVV